MVFFVSPKHYAVVFPLASLAYVVVSLGRCCSYPRSRCSAQVRIPRMVMVPIPLPTVTCISCPICQSSGNYILRDRNRGHITIPVLFFLQAGRPAPRSAQETFWGKIRISSANRSWVRPATSRASRIRPLTSTWIISFWLMGCFCIRCHQFNQNIA